MKNGRLILASISALCVISIGFAHAAEQAPPRTIHDITALLDQHKPDPVKVQELKLAATREPPAGMGKEALAAFYHERAQAAELLGMVTRQMEDLRRAEELAAAAGIEWRQIVRSIGLAEETSGNFANAWKRKEQLLARATTSGQRFVEHTGFSRWNLAIGDAGAARSELSAGSPVRPQAKFNGVEPVWRIVCIGVREGARGCAAS